MMRVHAAHTVSAVAEAEPARAAGAGLDATPLLIGMTAVELARQVVIMLIVGSAISSSIGTLSEGGGLAAMVGVVG